MIKVYIGFDPAETVAFHVLSQSIHALASEPVSITPIMLSQLGGVFDRPLSNLQSTQFSFSRFLTPYLCDYDGWAIFMDCDMLLRADIAELWALRDESYSIQVIKHQHTPKEELKFLDKIQTRYEKKNWSSVMLFNCARCKALTPEYVNTASGLELHQFKWLEDDRFIGGLPTEWNHLVGYDSFNTEAKNVHYTTGGPYFNEYADCEYADDWNLAKQNLLRVEQRNKNNR